MHLLSMFIRVIYISSIVCIYFFFKKMPLNILIRFYFRTTVLFICIISYFFSSKSFLFHIKALDNRSSIFYQSFFFSIFLYFLYVRFFIVRRILMGTIYVAKVLNMCALVYRHACFYIVFFLLYLKYVLFLGIKMNSQPFMENFSIRSVILFSHFFFSPI